LATNLETVIRPALDTGLYPIHLSKSYGRYGLKRKALSLSASTRSWWR